MSLHAQPTVLTVDDSTVMQEVIQQILSPDYRVLRASTALEALAVMNHEAVSILLLDISMPDIDGLDLCRTIRSLPNFSHLPIIMVTAKNSPFDKIQGRLAGATEYLTKPFDALQLRQMVDQLAGASLLNRTDAGSVLPLAPAHPAAEPFTET